MPHHDTSEIRRTISVAGSARFAVSTLHGVMRSVRSPWPKRRPSWRSGEPSRIGQIRLRQEKVAPLTLSQSQQSLAVAAGERRDDCVIEAFGRRDVAERII